MQYLLLNWIIRGCLLIWRSLSYPWSYKASAAVGLDSSVVWVITWREVVSNRHFGATNRPNPQRPFGTFWPLKMGPVVPKRRFQTTWHHVITQKTQEFTKKLIFAKETSGSKSTQMWDYITKRRLASNPTSFLGGSTFRYSPRARLSWLSFLFWFPQPPGKYRTNTGTYVRFVMWCHVVLGIYWRLGGASS